MNEEIQKHCLVLEKLLDDDCKNPRLTIAESNAINALLLELQCKGSYRLPNELNPFNIKM